MDATLNPAQEVNIAIVGKYMELLDAYKSLIEAINHGGIPSRTHVNISYIVSEDVEANGLDMLHGQDAILVPGGFGERGIAGKVLAVQYARENKVPYLGICLGLHTAVIEFARNVAGLGGANSTEFDRECEHPVIAMISEWTTASGSKETRNEDSDLGGTMRLGGQQCRLEPDSTTRKCYGKDVITERHRHRYEVNNNYLDKLTDAGMRIVGRSMDGMLVEVIEVPDHPWFVCCQFHPEFTSTPRDCHPLFTGFIDAALQYKAQKQ